MRKTTVLHTIIIALVAIFFSACNEQAASGTAPNRENTAPASGLKLAHIQSDSLQTGYTALAKELAKLEENFNKAQDNIGKEANALQKEASSLQTKMQQGLLSPNQIQAEQQRLGRKEQEIMQRRDVAMGSIQEEQMQLQAAFTAKVKEVLDAIREEKGYDYILNLSSGTGVLAANPGLDITPLVLERLNALDSQLDTTAVQ